MADPGSGRTREDFLAEVEAKARAAVARTEASLAFMLALLIVSKRRALEIKLSTRVVIDIWSIETSTIIGRGASMPRPRPSVLRGNVNSPPPHSSGDGG
jgi:hypothetical protein